MATWNKENVVQSARQGMLSTLLGKMDVKFFWHTCEEGSMEWHLLTESPKQYFQVSLQSERKSGDASSNWLTLWKVSP